MEKSNQITFDYFHVLTAAFFFLKIFFVDPFYQFLFLSISFYQLICSAGSVLSACKVAQKKKGQHLIRTTF